MWHRCGDSSPRRWKLRSPHHYQPAKDRRRSGGWRPAILFGSSLGGYLAALYAARHADSIEKLVLLAPAFQFPSRWRKRYTPEELDRWRREGFAEVFHYGENRVMRLGYQLMEDSIQYEDEPDARQPTLIFHGTKDDVVPYEISEAFCVSHPTRACI
ncbi:MAG: alpha/beta fold hydrolase [Acidobacteriota bacterium]